MKKLILILAVALVSCKKESTNPVVGNWTNIAIIESGIYTPVNNGETYRFYNNGTYTNSITGNGSYSVCNDKIIIDNSVYDLLITSRQIKIGNKLYFN